MVGAKIVYKAIEDTEGLEQAVALQGIVWGENDAVTVPHFIAVIHNGGSVIGAFDAEKLIGFCFGFPGFNGKEVYLCSHMLAIDPDYRNYGIGRQLKLKQREWALEQGYKKMVWTYDPLEARNGYLNLCKLGGYVTTYLPAYYGQMSDRINQGLPSDRFLLEWDLNSSRAVKAVSGETLTKKEWETYEKLCSWEECGGFPRPIDMGCIQSVIPDNDRSNIDPSQGYLVPVPQDIQAIKQKELELAIEWRMTLQELFMQAFAQSYVVTGLLRMEGDVHYYVLEKYTQKVHSSSRNP